MVVAAAEALKTIIFQLDLGFDLYQGSVGVLRIDQQLARVL